MLCGTEGSIKVGNSLRYDLMMGGESGSNNREELLDLCLVLYFSMSRQFNSIEIFGDSKITIDWANGISNLRVFVLEGWKCCTRNLIQHFERIYMKHIFREHNGHADKLSKEAIGMTVGEFSVAEFRDHVQVGFFSVSLI